MVFFNKRGGKAKTTMSENIMNQISDLTEKELIQKDIFYLRDNTKFQVRQENIPDLLKAQKNANIKLIEEGVITMDMVQKDLIANS